MRKQSELFQPALVPGKPSSGLLFEEEQMSLASSNPVTCLGVTFGQRRVPSKCSSEFSP
ncbi:MAG: hypothetical protein BWX66_00183 [Deltaproteobacteria bacterium ADurb.Bin058]|jgi:hypothetical protein|nr:MAG: hypothetical protein BWX66_00183 [Deltaproteobacteria bacterium ADurb.Bin058]